MKSARQALGQWGESLAAAYLSEQGYTVLERNARSRFGEIDLVARQGDSLVFVEVKTRTSAAFGLPEDSVTPRKQAHLVAAAQAYLVEHPELGEDWRVDVIAIECRRGQPPRITHFENAIR